jgi:hypothetical protein
MSHASLFYAEPYKGVLNMRMSPFQMPSSVRIGNLYPIDLGRLKYVPLRADSGFGSWLAGGMLRRAMPDYDKGGLCLRPIKYGYCICLKAVSAAEWLEAGMQCHSLSLLEDLRLYHT